MAMVPCCVCVACALVHPARRRRDLFSNWWPTGPRANKLPPSVVDGIFVKLYIQPAAGAIFFRQLMTYWAPRKQARAKHLVEGILVKLCIQPAAGAIFPIDGLLGPAQTSSRQAARGRDAPQSLRQLEEPTLVWPSRPGAFEGPTLVWPWRPVAFEWLVYWYIQPAAGAFFFSTGGLLGSVQTSSCQASWGGYL